jgi:hypothetical protein
MDNHLFTWNVPTVATSPCLLWIEHVSCLPVNRESGEHAVLELIVVIAVIAVVVVIVVIVVITVIVVIVVVF